jgi:hypothetical protein
MWQRIQSFFSSHPQEVKRPSNCTTFDEHEVEKLASNFSCSAEGTNCRSYLGFAHAPYESFRWSHVEMYEVFQEERYTSVLRNGIIEAPTRIYCRKFS